jgi:hypothetical protein
MEKQKHSIKMDLASMSKQAIHLRNLYHQIEESSLGRVWSLEEDMIGFAADVGIIGRLVLAASGTWDYGSDMQAELKRKIPECIWWLLVLSSRLGIDIAESYQSFTEELEKTLQK